MKLSVLNISDEAHVQRIRMDLSTTFNDAIQVDQLPSTESPLMKITYTPAFPDVLTRGRSYSIHPEDKKKLAR
jgi:hypothetical protein